MPRIFRMLLAALLIFQSALALANSLEELEATLESLHSEGAILGAQMVVGNGERILLECVIGIRSAIDKTPVDADTQFCIGSCSKPFSAAAILTLVQSDDLSLDDPIDSILPEFEALKIADSEESARAPNLRELLAHRGGIYSQKRGMNRRQARWIRDFRLSLEDSVEGIAGEALIFEPGTDYAYSGAGYCIVGRVAEVALDRPFERIFQENVAHSLGLQRTTFFPTSEERNIATGSVDGRPNKTTPHLYRPFELPLIGGSLYSTARDSAKFLSWVAAKGSDDSVDLLDETHFDLFTKPHFKGRGYGLGWSFKIRNRKVIELGHTGALASSRAAFRVNLDNGNYVATLYTLTHPKHSNDVGRRLAGAISRFASGSESP